MNCGECLMKDVAVVAIGDDGLCPKCGTNYNNALDMEDEEPEIMRVLVLSSAHLSKAESEVDHGLWPCFTLAGEYGFISYIADLEDQDGYLEGGKASKDWPGLLAAAALAKRLKLDWVRFDADANTHNDLPVFDW